MEPAFSNIQLELLKLYATNLSDNEIVELKDLLAKFYADKATKEADKLWEEKGYNNDYMEQLLNEDAQ